MNQDVQQANRWLAQHNLINEFELIYQEDKLTLIKKDEPKTGGVQVDFVSGVLDHRRKFGGGRGEAIAKAVGIKKDYLPTVMDATAGLGRDAYVLASIGCTVHLFERHPVVYALLKDGLERAYLNAEIGEWMQNRMTLIHHNSYEYLFKESDQFDVVYLDPMFPHRQKSALVKKEMRLFQSLVGSDEDADQLLPMALKIAKKRVVVKRPSSAGFLGEIKTNDCIKTKSHRFDLYHPSMAIHF